MACRSIGLKKNGASKPAVTNLCSLAAHLGKKGNWAMWAVDRHTNTHMQLDLSKRLTGAHKHVLTARLEQVELRTCVHMHQSTACTSWAACTYMHTSPSDLFQGFGIPALNWSYIINYMCYTGRYFLKGYYCIYELERDQRTFLKHISGSKTRAIG